MPPKSRFESYLNGVIEAGWLAALVIAPLFFNVFSSRVFEPDKVSLIRSIALIMLIAWLVKLVETGRAWLPAYRPPGVTDAAAVEGEAPVATKWWQFWRIPLLLPIALMILAYAISTTFSVARFVSWWGSYQRLQGTYTFVSYVIIALLAMGHLRTPGQIRRIQHAIIVTSLPIAIYGILQHYAIDPLPWGGDVQTRVAANAGNAIFLAAYLIMAVFFTLERVYSSFAYLLSSKPDADQGQDMPTALAGGFYLFVLLVQFLTIFWTQSRGPWLGLFMGLYLFPLLLFTALRPKYHRGLTIGWVSLGVAGAVLLVVMNTTPYFTALRSVPYFGRLTTLMDQEGTGRVRTLIWEGAAKLVQPHTPLIRPDGSSDTLNAVRPLIGYGPEAMWIAFNRFYPPELAHVESRNASPDRSHNETWDSLVITGLLGFVAYLALFISIFYWALRWLGILVNRRDNWLFGGLLAVCAIGVVTLFYVDDGGWRFFGVALPGGIILGLFIYVTLAVFLHPNLQPSRGDLPRQLLIITLLATITAHFLEINFGIAIAATRTYFWVQTALLLVLGMRWATPEAFALSQEPVEEVVQVAGAKEGASKGKRTQRPATPAPRRQAESLPWAPATVMTDLLIFLTFVFIYTTNSRGLTSAFDVLKGAVSERIEGGQVVGSPYVLYLMLFTWLVASTVGLAAEAVHQRRAPRLSWWGRGYALHALIVWGGWLIYGLWEGQRLLPASAGANLTEQLQHVAGHFAVYTWILVVWLLVAAAVYGWRWLRDQRMPYVERALAPVLGAALAVFVFVIIANVNISLVRADIIYKQGQQFDNQGDWVSSVELYRRALDARRTEDHYMLFLGRALLEQAKKAQPDGPYKLPEQPALRDVLALTPETVSQMGRLELLRAAEVVLSEAQRVNPLNTDHTANLARLYRTWGDLMTDNPEMRQAMLDKSIAAYDMAVTLSPNAAHLWNEKGNAHLAREERDQAEQAYLHSLSLDQQYDQTYLLLSDFYQRQDDYDKSIELLRQGMENLPRNAQIASFLGVALARQGDLQGAIDANLKVLELRPGDTGAIRNLALLYRDLGNAAESVNYAEQAIAATDPANAAELKALHELAAQQYQALGQIPQAISHLEQARALAPDDPGVLTALAGLYAAAQATPQGVDVLRTLASLEPGNYQYPLQIAQLLQQSGDKANALVYASQAFTLAPVEQKDVISALITMIGGG